MAPGAEEADPAGSAGSPPPPVRITLTFDGPDRANVAVGLENVTPAQLYLAAWFLDSLAREVRQGQLQKEALATMAPGGQPALDRIFQDIMAGRRPPERSPRA